jgi:hypothetical protein
MGLLGDEVVELLFWDNTISVGVGTFDHFLEDGVVGELSQIFGDLADVLEGDEAGLLGVVSDEDLVDFIAGLVVGRSGGHHVEELRELDLSAAVLVELGDHLVDCLRLGLDSEGVDGDLEFWMRWGVPLGSMAPPRSRSK